MSEPVFSSSALVGEDLSTERLLTVEEVAARWQVPKTQVYRLARDEKLDKVQIGRYVRFQLSSVRAFESNGGSDD